MKCTPKWTAPNCLLSCRYALFNIKQRSGLHRCWRPTFKQLAESTSSPSPENSCEAYGKQHYWHSCKDVISLLAYLIYSSQTLPERIAHRLKIRYSVTLLPKVSWKPSNTHWWGDVSIRVRWWWTHGGCFGKRADFFWIPNCRFPSLTIISVITALTGALFMMALQVHHQV